MVGEIKTNPLSKEAARAVVEAQAAIAKIYADKPATEVTDGCDMNWVTPNGEHYFVIVRRAKYRKS